MWKEIDIIHETGDLDAVSIYSGWGMILRHWMKYNSYLLGLAKQPITATTKCVSIQKHAPWIQPYILFVGLYLLAYLLCVGRFFVILNNVIMKTPGIES